MARASDAESLLQQFIDLEKVDDSEREELQAVVAGSDTIALAPELTTEQGEISALSGGIPQGTLNRASALVDDTEAPPQISKLRLPEKVKLAMFGNGYARAILIRDPNRMVQTFVLKNPRIQLREIEEFARNPNLSEQVMRFIAANEAWTKSYQVKVNLVCNPKTPGDVALKWIRYLNVPELRKIAKSKNLPQVVVTVARKRLEEMAR